jgi:hypothetical protein
MTRTDMRKIACVLGAVAVVVLLTLPAVAQQTDQLGSPLTINDSGSGTLLGPYFEVDLSNPTGMNTIFTLNHPGSTSVSISGPPNPNPSGPTAGLTRVTIWSDLGVPVSGFNMYLTGFDVDRIDMRKVLNGQFPQTASAGQDPADQISPKGRDSQDINFASCNGVLPQSAMSASQIANLQASLTGNPNPSGGATGKCAGAPHSDNIARGYITIDMVNSCGLQGPADAGYIQNVLTPASPGYSNVLTGEVYYVDQLHGVVRGDSMVHIHGSATDPLTTTAGDYTFYGRYDGFNAADHLQPLPNSFNARYVNGNFSGAALGSTSAPAWGVAPTNPPAGSTSLVVWRDSKVSNTFFTCGTTPAPYPLPQEDITAFDEQEHPQSVVVGVNQSKFTFGAAFPLGTQVVKVGSAALPVSFTSGWIYLNLSHSAAPGPTSDPAAAQAWVQVIEQSGPQTSNLMHRAQAADSGTQASHVVVQ